MSAVVRALLLCLLLGAANGSLAEAISAPAVVLSGIEADISGALPGANTLRVTLPDGTVRSVDGDGQLVLSDLIVTERGTLRIELLDAERIVASEERPVIPAWVSLLPPLLAIGLAFALRSVIPAMLVGLMAGAWAVNGLSLPGAVAAFFDTVAVYILGALVDRDRLAILVFTLLIGGMVGIITRNGGMLGTVNRMLPLARTPRRGQAVIAGLGLGIFFDDYANTMIVGNAARPISDRLRISREKLAYLVDSTAAPVATVALVTTWIGFQVGLIENALEFIGETRFTAYGLFLQSIPYSFYPFLALALVFIVVISGRDFGPMYRAELRARVRGEVTASETSGSLSAEEAELSHREGIPCRAINAVLPIITLVVGVIGGIFISGEGDSLQAIVSTADTYLVLIWASLLACAVATVLTLGQRLLGLEEIVESWMAGAGFMLTGLVILVMAWAVADVTDALQTAPYLISILGDVLTPWSLPTLIFLVAALAGFASGSSWGAMAILMPLVIPLCWAVLQAHNMTEPEHLHILYSSIACVLTGCVWADHCSPISDTTVLSSIATRCNHMDHVSTQLPYAMLGGIAALLLGTLPAGLGLPWWLGLVLGFAAVWAAHRLLGRSVDDAARELGEATLPRD